MNTPVKFELAKLLKEKEFDGNYFHYWNMVNHSGEWKVDTRIWEYTDNYIEAPIIAEVIMWLYEKHGIWIQTPFSHNDAKPFCWVINTTIRNISEEDEDKNCWLSGIGCNNVDGFDSPTEAYEAAIEYTLENLI